MYIVTGGAGFIGSNIISRLNSMGIDDIIIVDDLIDDSKHKNLNLLRFYDLVDKKDFIERFRISAKKRYDLVFHQGACTDTMENNGRYMMNNNYFYSTELLDSCLAQGIRFIYASSAAVYGSGTNGFKEERFCENPLNVYGHSKFLFDQYVRRLLPVARSQIAGLRYFNVYGPGESHKGRMASVIYQFHRQIQDNKTIRLFAGSENFLRDFVYVKDIVDINIFFMEHPDKNGIFNCGTGMPCSFSQMTEIMKKEYADVVVEYIDFPQELKEKYQAYTRAETGKLMATGFPCVFTSPEDGVREYTGFLKG